MAKFIQNGDKIDYINSTESKIKYGDIVILGTRIGISCEDIEIGASGGVSLTGIYEMPAVSTEAFVVGDMLYLDDTYKVTKSKGVLTVVAGMAVEAKNTSGIAAVVKI